MPALPAELILGHLIVVKEKGSLFIQLLPVSRGERAATFQGDCVRVLCVCGGGGGGNYKSQGEPTPKSQQAVADPPMMLEEQSGEDDERCH